MSFSTAQLDTEAKSLRSRADEVDLQAVQTELARAAAKATNRQQLLQDVARIVNTEVDAIESQARRLAALTELVAIVGEADDAVDACHLLVDDLRAYFNCEQVTIGLCKSASESCHVIASSSDETPLVEGEETRLAQAVLQESIARGEVAVWPPTNAEDRFGLLAHRQFLQRVKGETLLSGPLRDKLGEAQGAWFMVGKQELAASDMANFVKAAERPLAAALQLLARAKRGRLQQFVGGACEFVQERRGRAILVAAALCLALLLIPVRYRAKCDCQLEPVVRRYVAAPFDGSLEEAFVKPGDLVVADQLIARMDGREIRWELAGAQADFHRATKERAGFMASHDSGKAQIAKHEMDRLQQRTELLKHRDTNLEIRSPIDGIVVDGDLEKAEGAPLTVGQTLFEIAPLDQMVVELAVDEDDVALVKRGMPVRIQFDAFPMQRFDATLERIHPRSELRESENVFVAEVRLENSERKLRPGMRGRAWIAANRGPLGWSLIRRPLATALAWLGW